MTEGAAALSAVQSVADACCAKNVHEKRLQLRVKSGSCQAGWGKESG